MRVGERETDGAHEDGGLGPRAQPGPRQDIEPTEEKTDHAAGNQERTSDGNQFPPSQIGFGHQDPLGQNEVADVKQPKRRRRDDGSGPNAGPIHIVVYYHVYMDCKHFGACGGCRCEPGSSGRPKPPPYADELAQKEKCVREFLSAYEVGEWRSILPSPQEWHYRNKMEYAFAVWDDHLVLGLREAGRFDRIVDLDTCFLMSPESLEILKRVRRWAHDHGLQGYHRRRHEGDLRYLVLRE